MANEVSCSNSSNNDINASIQNDLNRNTGLYEDQEPNSNEEFQSTVLSRDSTFLERVQTKYSFFNANLKDKRTKLITRFGLIYLVIATLVLGIFSIYWGSLYKRNSKMKDLRMLVVIEDDHTIDNIEPIIGNNIRNILETSDASNIGQWHLFNSNEFNEIAMKHGNNIEQELERQIRHQNYWSSIYVKPNATYNLYKAIIDNNQSYNSSNNTIVSIYETGRDLLNMNSYITPNVKAIEKMWLALQPNIILTLINKIDNKAKVLSNNASLKLLMTPITFVYYDKAPSTNPVAVAPSQVGLIYLIIVTLYQFNFFLNIHLEVAKYNLKNHHYIAYRLISSILSFFVLSLVFSLVSLAMQVDFQRAFGKSGFLVYWMTSFLTMWVAGLMNEIMIMIILVFYSPLIGFWILFWVIINISPTFTPMALTAKIFRYGYVMPIYNSYEITKVILFNTWKGHLGRNYGILMIWIVILTFVFPFVLRFFMLSMIKKAKAASKINDS